MADTETETLATGPDREGRAPWHARLRQRLQAERLRDLPLRVRLVAILTALALVALAITGALAVTLLRRELIGRVDAQVRSIAMTARHDGRIPMTSPGGDRHGRLPTTTFGAVRVDTGSFYTDTDRLDSPYGTPAVRDLQPAEVARHHDQPFTVPAENGAGRWRVVALRVDTTEGPGTLIVGQSLEDVDETVARMTIVLLVVGLGVLVAVGLLGGLVVRRELRPLTEVEDVAEQIAGGDLSRRVPDHPTSTEVGRLSASLNAMLSQIEQSFAVRAASPPPPARARGPRPAGTARRTRAPRPAACAARGWRRRRSGASAPGTPPGRRRTARSGSASR